MSNEPSPFNHLYDIIYDIQSDFKKLKDENNYLKIRLKIVEEKINKMKEITDKQLEVIRHYERRDQIN
ncbi:hypothetical protein M153_2110005837 [Pseudoloma neurophilia]|uniref:Uncharacterized protein n=1 Tax=Pseudoloma neurophilia TaxID=146866 RepID=A0A0R0M613_9MICR|nr:hypothetical protein M153_2110005837 [Pseudoloma neurophilia]